MARSEDPNAAASAAFGDHGQTPAGWAAPVAARPAAAAPPVPGELAGWGARVVATLVDLVVVGFAYVVLITLGALVSEALGALVALGGVPAMALYAPLCVARLGGQTLGKRAVGIAVRHADGRPVGLGAAFARETVLKGLVMGALSFLVIGLLGFLWPLWDPQRRAWHDLPLDTRVVRA